MFKMKTFNVHIEIDDKYEECMIVKAKSKKDAINKVLDVINNVSIYDFKKHKYKLFAERIYLD